MSGAPRDEVAAAAAFLRFLEERRGGGGGGGGGAGGGSGGGGGGGSGGGGGAGARAATIGALQRKTRSEWRPLRGGDEEGRKGTKSRESGSLRRHLRVGFLTLPAPQDRSPRTGTPPGMAPRSLSCHAVGGTPPLPPHPPLPTIAAAPPILDAYGVGGGEEEEGAGPPRFAPPPRSPPAIPALGSAAPPRPNVEDPHVAAPNLWMPWGGAAAKCPPKSRRGAPRPN